MIIGKNVHGIPSQGQRKRTTRADDVQLRIPIEVEILTTMSPPPEESGLMCVVRGLRIIFCCYGPGSGAACFLANGLLPEGEFLVWNPACSGYSLVIPTLCL